MNWAAIGVGVAILAAIIRGIVWFVAILLRIDRRIYSIATNHLPHLYERMQQLDGREVPDLGDLQ